MSGEKGIILIIEDEEDFRKFLVKKFTGNYKIIESVTGDESLKSINLKPDLVILDLGLPERANAPPDHKVGFGLLEKIKEADTTTQVIVITGTAREMEDAVRALKEGAFDYILKDKINDDPERLPTTVKNALERRRLLIENQRLFIQNQRFTELFAKEQKKDYDYGDVALRNGIKYHFGNLVGNSEAMQEVYELINKFSGRKREPDVLITGETGTGKEMLASAIHFNSSRKDKPMVKVSISDLTPTLIESELFGHVKGAFTDAKEDKIGYFEKADGSTLFIDEISEVPKEIQVKLLRAIQEKVIQRVGSTKPISVDVRIIAATNKDLEKAVKDGSFREDLFYRLNVIPIHLPPLRERLEDVPDLTRHFIHKISVEEKEELSIDLEAIEYLKGFDYPGNVRQLENVIRRAVYLRTNNRITLTEIKTSTAYEKPPLTTLDKSRVTEIVKTPGSVLHAPSSKFLQAYIEEKGNLDKAGTKLGISHATVYKQFEEEKEGMFISLCNAHGNIEALADGWNVPTLNLQLALAKKNRILQFIIAGLEKNGNDEERLAKRLDVPIEDFTKALNRLKEIKSKETREQGNKEKTNPQQVEASDIFGNVVYTKIK